MNPEVEAFANFQHRIANAIADPTALADHLVREKILDEEFGREQNVGLQQQRTDLMEAVARDIRVNPAHLNIVIAVLQKHDSTEALADKLKKELKKLERKPEQNAVQAQKSSCNVLLFIGPTVLVVVIGFLIAFQMGGQKPIVPYWPWPEEPTRSTIGKTAFVSVGGQLYPWLKRPDSHSAIVESTHDSHPVFTFMETLESKSEKMKQAFRRSYYGLHKYPVLREEIQNLAISFAKFHAKSMNRIQQFAAGTLDILLDLEAMCSHLKNEKKRAAEEALNTVVSKIEVIINKSTELKRSFQTMLQTLNDNHQEVFEKKLQLHNNQTHTLDEKEGIEKELVAFKAQTLKEVMKMFKKPTEENGTVFDFLSFNRIYRLLAESLKSAEPTKYVYDQEAGVDENFKNLVSAIQNNPDLLDSLVKMGNVEHLLSALNYSIPALQYVLGGIKSVSMGVNDTIEFFELLEDDLVSLKSEIKRQFELVTEKIFQPAPQHIAEEEYEPFKIRMVESYSRLLALRSICITSARQFGYNRQEISGWIDEDDVRGEAFTDIYQLVDFVNGLQLPQITHIQHEEGKETEQSQGEEDSNPEEEEKEENVHDKGMQKKTSNEVKEDHKEDPYSDFDLDEDWEEPDEEVWGVNDQHK